MSTFNKLFLASLGLGLFASQTAHAQLGIGYGATAPRTMLDVNGAVSLAETAVAVSGNAATIPTNASQVRLTGTATANVALTSAASPTPVTGQRVTIYNTSGFDATFNSQNIPAGQSVLFVYSNGGFRATGGGGNAFTANNGLTKTGSNVQLGGNLVQATTVTNNGNALNVAGSGGSTTFTSAGFVGIGTANPAARLNVAGASSLAAAMDYSSADAAGSVINARKSRGTTAAPAAVVANDFLGFFMSDGYDGTAYSYLSGGMYANATENWSSTAHGNRLLFATTPNGATSFATRMTIDQNGYVGIGTTAPYSLLSNTTTNTAGSDGFGVNSGSLDWGMNIPGYVGAFYNGSTSDYSNGLAVKVTGTSQLVTAFDVSQSSAAAGSNSGGTSLMTIKGNGHVGIGTNNPGYPLEVATAATVSYGAYSFLSYTDPATTGRLAGGGNYLVSIRSGGRVLAPEFNALSDIRLKRVIGLSNTTSDLTLLNKLRITDYQMLDRAQYGNQKFKKVIAQEVEAVFPQAVHEHMGFLPDVYASATAVQALPGDSLVAITLPTALAGTGAMAGQRLKLVGPTGEVLANVARPAAAGSRTLVVRGAQQLAATPSKVFVFGLEHNDVRAVDYEALSMLNVSATQELSRRLEAAEAALRTQTASAAKAQAELQDVKASLQSLSDVVKQLQAGSATASSK
ncbi:MAG: tail fiber domain-containing protein [Janthinobacterium lividum]